MRFPRPTGHYVRVPKGCDDVLALLEVKGLCKAFVKDKTRFAAVDGVSLSLEPGECLGLVGESGCGKSTTAQLLARLLKEDQGEIWFQGQDLRKSTVWKSLRRDLQMIFQNPADSFDPRYTLLTSVKQGLRYLERCTKSELEERAKEAIACVGLKESYWKRPIHQLSGGECQRAAIARAMIANPKLIICDEATSALDVSVQAQIVALLQRLKQEKQLAYLFITHDLALAASVCDRIAVMYRGRIVETGQALAIIHQPQHPYTQMLLSCVLPASVTDSFSLPEWEPQRQTGNGCAFYPYCPNAIPQCREESPILSSAGNREIACFHPHIS